jgi:uncharacterized glyoxalase superfamily protein PhnB
MPSSTVIPELPYEELGEAIEWLTAAFGFRLRWSAGNHRAQLAVGDGAVALTDRGTPPVGVVVRVDDVDSHHERAQLHGAKIVRAPEDHPYGERQYTAEDPGGNHWTFSETIADVAPEEWGGSSGAIG